MKRVKRSEVAEPTMPQLLEMLKRARKEVGETANPHEMNERLKETLDRLDVQIEELEKLIGEPS